MSILQEMSSNTAPQISRRQALGGLAATATLTGWTAAAERPVPIIDTHTHFYDPTRKEGVPWPSKDDKVLYRPVLPEDFRKLTAPLGVVGTVVVEASDRLEDNQWVLDLAAKDNGLLGLVGHLKPTEAGFADHVRRFAANARFRGIRIGHQLLKTKLADRTFLRDLELLAERKLVLDVNGGPELLPDVAVLAKSLRDLRIVVNHLANVAIDGQSPPAAWRRGMSDAAQGKNVACKVSALVEGAARDGRKAPADPAFYRPVLDVAWETFGPERLMFGSNWPVSERAADYRTLLSIVQADVAHRKADAGKLFAANARRIYGVSEAPG